MKYSMVVFTGMLLSAGAAYGQDTFSEEQPDTYTETVLQEALEQLDEYNEGGDSESAPSYYPVDPSVVSQKKGYDTEAIDVKRFDNKTWESIVGDENYSQDPAVRKRKQPRADSTRSASTKSNRRIRANPSDDADDEEEAEGSISSPIASPLLSIVVYALAIAIIGYILFLVIKNISLKPTAKKITRSDSTDQSTPVEDIKELEIDRLLREASASGNYRLVIRIYFLGLLKKLDEDGLIVWKKDKTNREYLSELFSKAHYFEDVRDLTLAYEQVWYGDHTFPEETYAHIIASFKAIDQKIKASKPSEKR